MKVTENYCNGCPECRHCRLEKDVTFEVCSSCETDLTNKTVYEIGTEYYCKECAWEELETNFKDEVLSEYEVSLD